MRFDPRGSGRPPAKSAVDEYVVLVDARDVACGVAEKLAAHRLGLRHRAFSVFLFDDAGRLLLQRRASTKYHSPGLWTNTCCGHPRPDETLVQGARRRLREELGIDAPLLPLLSFEYRAEVGGGLIEHEVDHVLIGRWSGEPRPDPAEASAWRWTHPASALEDARRVPELYTAWFAPALERLARPAPFASRLR